MPIRPPALDDRSFNDLVEEALARIPAHTPEWTHPRIGDPGRTLVELFAWLTDTLLYRANLIPERQRLAFLRLLGIGLRPARPASSVVSVFLDESFRDSQVTDSVTLRPLATLKGPVPFETRSELTVLPVTAACYHKRPLTEKERQDQAAVLEALRQVYALNTEPAYYTTAAVFPDGMAAKQGFDLISETIDQRLWIALLAPEKVASKSLRLTLGGADGLPRLLSIGVTPQVTVPSLTTEIGPRARIPHVFEISTGQQTPLLPEYLPLEVVADTTAGLTRRGVLRLRLPAAENIGAPSDDVRVFADAGTGDHPPRLDDPVLAERIVAWVRLRPTAPLASLRLSWVGINAVEIDQIQTLSSRIVGQSSGAADQQLQLPATSVVELSLQVEEPGVGYVVWSEVDDLAQAGRDSRVYALDREAGTVRFGDGVRGRIPESGMRIRAAVLRAGGGAAGNLPPLALTNVEGRDLSGATVTRKLKVVQSLTLDGGQEAETLAMAEQRIPGLLRHGNRAVTAEDYRRLALDTPGAAVARVEVLPRFKPQQMRQNTPGVVSVMVLPEKALPQPPNPRPDRPFLETVHAYLDERRTLGTELYTIGCEYVSVGIGVGITVHEGLEFAAVVNAVREALRRFLWPLPPGGPDGQGWPLGRGVSDREVEVAVARVSGVAGVAQINLFRKKETEGQEPRWQHIERLSEHEPVVIELAPWQLPELLSVVISEGDSPEDLQQDALGLVGLGGLGGATAVAVPVTPEVC